jgi:hypothetical protein
MIRAYNEATGVKNTSIAGYHETVTLASLRATHHAVAAWAGGPLHEICNSLLAARFGNPDWLLEYWSRDRLFSAAARLGWVEADLQPLPF